MCETGSGDPTAEGKGRNGSPGATDPGCGHSLSPGLPYYGAEMNHAALLSDWMIPDITHEPRGDEDNQVSFRPAQLRVLWTNLWNLH